MSKPGEKKIPLRTALIIMSVLFGASGTLFAILAVVYAGQNPVTPILFGVAAGLQFIVVLINLFRLRGMRTDGPDAT